MPTSASSSPPGAPPVPSLPQLLAGLLDDLPGVVGGRVHLFTLELRRAQQALLKMVVFGVAAALLAITAWLAFWIGLSAAAIALGIPWPWVASAVILLNAAAAGMALRHVMQLVPLLGLPATVRRLTPGPGGQGADMVQGTAP